MAKFAEDERLEQMNAQKRRMRELEHKREIERIWNERLVVYQAQRAIEEAERNAKRAEEDEHARVIFEAKARLLAEHAAVFEQHYPKAKAMYDSQK